jgi:amino-acid N-acetyltransferase
MNNVLIRPAVPDDAPAIKRILDLYVEERIVLPRSEDDIRFYSRNFVVAEVDGVCRGCCAARDFGGNLLEIRSLAVERGLIGRGLGRLMVEFIIERLKEERSQFRLFALTLRADFFQKLGFEIVEKELFPEKIWSDCDKCPKKDCCDEIAVLISHGF